MRTKPMTSMLRWILFCGLFYSVVPECDIGWFGSDCQYKCHCTGNECDANGICTPGSTCEKEWFGPACQYENLTYTGGRFSLLSLPNKDDTTCVTDADVQQVKCSFTYPTPFTWMRIEVKDTDQVPNFLLQFKQHNTDPFIDCKNLRNATVTKTSMDIHCDLDVPVDEVILTGEEVQSLSSISISGGRNVALKQNTSQSSNHSNERLSKYAVDGSFTIYGRYTHTNAVTDSSPNWNVTFTKPKLVNRYVLYNRPDGCCQDRLKGFVLTSFTESGSTIFKYKDTEISSQKVYNVTSTGVKQPVSHVMIQATYVYNPGRIVLSLGEVEIFGESACPSGKYGPDCNQLCNCAKEDEKCFVSTGGCPSGCAFGFYGEDCQTECPFKYHGIDCKERCNTSCLNESCNATTGVCLECISGKSGDYCQSDCPVNKFGKGCNETCSNNCVEGPPKNTVCDSVNGTCLSGCKTGYLGQMCNNACPNETYGSGCGSNCSSFCNRNTTNETSICDHVTGQCLHGCISNYLGEMCMEKVSQLKGEDEDNTPIIVGVVVACLVLMLLVVVGVILWRKRRNLKSNSQSDNESVVDIPVMDKTTTSKVNADQKKNCSKGTEYYNMVRDLENTAIAVEDLNDFMLSHDRQFFEDQFYKIPTNSDVAMTVALSAENNCKNRYKNICAFDHSRVHLTANASKKHGDYINASYIEGYKVQEKFIASQGPNKVMINDFIRMLWEQKTEKVVMLTNLVEEGRAKCERYWPEKDETRFGDIKVKLTTTDVFADYTIRRLQLSKAGESVQNLTQFHFTSWPDKDVPTTPWGLVDFGQRVVLEPTDKPVVVHCSAGVGRTGTFIALCNVMKEAEDTGRMNFFSTLHKLRQERVMMIQTVSQYIFLHKAVQVAMVCMGTTVTTGDITVRMKTLESEAGKDGTKMSTEFKALCRLSLEIKEEDTKADAEDDTDIYQNTSSNHLKNRFQDIVPLRQSRPFLACDSSEMDNYINAVFVPGFTKQNQIILTQLPLPTTISDFWRMITQYKISLIVAFELDLKNKDKTIVDYLPPGEDEPINCPPFDIQTGPVTLGDSWEKQRLSVSKQCQKRNRLSLSQSQVKEHKLISLKCTTTDIGPKSMLALMKEIRSNTPAGGGMTVYVCRNGAEYSGLACVLSILMDRMDHDQCLAVPLVVGTVKSIRPQVISSLTQYKFLYQVLQRYSQTQSSYCNTDQTSFKSKSAKGTSNPAFEGSKEDSDHVYANTTKGDE